MSQLNRENITYNIQDALEELKRFDRRLSFGEKLDEVEFEMVSILIV